MRSIGRVEGQFTLMVGVELSCNIVVEVSVEFFFGCGEICTVVRNNFFLVVLCVRRIVLKY